MTTPPFEAELADQHVLNAQQADELLRGATWSRFAVLGDSMAEGIMEATAGYEHAPWAERVHAALKRANPELEFLNTGWRGVVSAQVRADQLPKALEFKPDLAGVICGGNDFLAPEFDVSVYQDNLEAIVAPLVEAGTTVFVYSLIDITRAIPELGKMRPRMEQLNAATLAVAEKYGAIWVPCWEHPAAGDRNAYSSDMLHMSARGHAIIASETLAALGRHLGNEAALPENWGEAAPEPEGLGDESAISGVYDYLLGGKDHSEDERKVAERALASVPGIKVLVWEDRKFIKRLVRFYARQGFTQILDIGAGIPSRGRVHEIAHAVNPDIKVVYADINDVAIARYKEMLEDVPNAWVVKADLTKPEELLATPEVQQLDFTKPIAVMFLGVLHFIPSEILLPAMRVYREALAPGSMIGVSHGAGTDASAGEAYDVYARAFGFATMRNEQELTELFGDFELVEPGVVKLPDWRPDPSPFSSRYANLLGPVHYLGGVAVKPAPAE
ncbi:SAM-dependent methyltransferase [Streptomyces sp. NPDC013455]|uniref:SAM-dependent methyltransferase n=1 Tax=Streptomyces sp. NPDC013455 TaxID=3155605 RepID=UPI0033D747E6